MKKVITLFALILLFASASPAGIIRHGAKGAKKSAHVGKVVVKHAAHAAKVVAY